MIYCVEDERSICDLMVYTLGKAGYEALGFTEGKQLFAAIQEHKPDLIMLDIMLPGEDGLSILGHLKDRTSTRDIPVIMATAKNSEIDKVVGLNMGADDYLAKPFGMLEMVARVKAVLRRNGTAANGKGVKTLGRISINPEEHIVRVAGERINLTLKEFEILNLLMNHPGMVYSRDQILSIVWGIDYFGETRTVDVHIGTLRNKLGEDGDCIETVRGVGYRIEAS